MDHAQQILDLLVEMKAEQAETKVEVKSIVARLDKLNGSVARNTRDIGDIQVELAERRQHCPLIEEIDDEIRLIKEWMAGQTAVEKSAKQWMTHVWPFVWVALGAFLILVLSHSGSILKALQ